MVVRGGSIYTLGIDSASSNFEFAGFCKLKFTSIEIVVMLSNVSESQQF